MLKIGIMGCGHVADFGHAHAIRRTEGLQLAAVYDPDPRRVAEFAQKHDVPVGTTREDEFFAAGLDAVAIASPVQFHDENVTSCANAGVHVLCEKPISYSREEGELMIRVMEQAQRQFYVGYVYRFSPVAQRFRQWLRDGTIGDVRLFRMVYLWDLHGMYRQREDGTWGVSPLWNGRMLEGGPMVDCGVHMIDLVRWMTQSEVINVFGYGARVVSGYDAPDHAWAFLELENGMRADIEMSFTYAHTARDVAPQFTYEMIGTGGVAKFDRYGYRLEARHGQGTLYEAGAGEKDFDGMYRAFRDAILTGDPGDLASPADAMRVSDIAWEATQQAIARLPKPAVLAAASV